MPHVRPQRIEDSAWSASDAGVRDAGNARVHGVAVKTIRRWRRLHPQHGPGRKHERPIILADRQREIVERRPADLLQGLFHSDGSRVRNWATRTVAGERKCYDCPRWQFTNNSQDIQELCCWALDLLGIPWRQSSGGRSVCRGVPRSRSSIG